MGNLTHEGWAGVLRLGELRDKCTVTTASAQLQVIIMVIEAMHKKTLRASCFAVTETMSQIVCLYTM